MYQHILVTLDGSELGESVLPHVEAIAKGCEIGGKITLLQVVEPLHLFRGLESSLQPDEKARLEKDVEQRAQKYMKEIAGKLKVGDVKLETKVLHGDARQEIVDYAHDNAVDLIMIGSHGHSDFKKLVIGSVADRVARDACVPVFLVRPPQCRL